MFGLFKKKKKVDSSAINETAVSLLQLQISLGNVEDNDQFSSRINDEYGRGYIFGFCDALLQSSGINDVEAMASLSVIHMNLFGEDAGGSMIARSFQDQGKGDFMKGCMLGGKELVGFLRNKKPAMGLASYLLKESR